MNGRTGNDLREKAIEILKHQEKQITADSIDFQTVIEELNIYHIELEHQNDNLLNSQYALEKSKERFTALFKFAPVAYIIIDAEGHISEINDLAMLLLDIPQSEQADRQISFSRYIDPEYQDIFYFHARKVCSKQSIDYCELVLNIKGEKVNVRLQSQYDPTCDEEDCKRILCSIIDISESKKIQLELFESNSRLQRTLHELNTTQTQLIRSERLSAVGQLTAGIAHDFNNILSGMIGYAELLDISDQRPEWMSKHLKALMEAGERASHLVKQLLDFSSNSIRDQQSFDVKDMLNKWFEFMRRTITENIRFSLELPRSGSFFVFGDPEQIRQVLTNLVINAKDAIADEGVIEVILRTQDDAHCIIEITDNGTGIPQEILEYIYEPFFTTKPIGKGTGLGLSQVYGIMRQHNGNVETIPNTPNGTIFRLTFPLVTREAPLSAPSDAATTGKEALLARADKSQTLLLVEDDAHMRDMIRDMLDHLGYRVLTARNGNEGLQQYRAHATKIDLIISDMVMPEMSGMKMLTAIRAEAPKIPVILISGHPMHSAPIDEHTVLLNKPFSFTTLSSVIQDNLEDC